MRFTSRMDRALSKERIHRLRELNTAKINQKMDKSQLDSILDACLYDSLWCEVHGIDYLHPNRLLARQRLYSEIILAKNGHKQDIPKLYLGSR